jgi:hypothetical protein
MKTKMQAFLIRTKEVVSKRLFLILLILGLASGGAYAQRFHGGGEIGGGHFYGGGFRSGVIVGGGYGGWGWGWGYPGLYMGLGYPFMFGYPGYPYGYGPNGYGASRLQMQLSDIKQDYADRIESVRSDMSLTGKERRQKVRELRHERDNAVEDAKRNYWKGPSNNNNAPTTYSSPGQNNQNNGNQNSQNNGNQGNGGNANNGTNNQ